MENNHDLEARTMETGLYGQNERGSYFTQRADENRFGDVGSEGIHEGLITEEQFRKMMALCICDEVKASRTERNLITWYNDLGPAALAPILPEMLVEAIGMTKEQQAQALQRLGVIAERMRDAGFHIKRVYDAITIAVPMALNLIKEENTKQHPNAKKPSIRSRAAAQVYNNRAIAMYGDEKKREEILKKRIDPTVVS